MRLVRGLLVAAVLTSTAAPALAGRRPRDQALELAVYLPSRPSAAVVDVLLRAQANPAIPWGPGKRTVLHWAVEKGAADVAGVLLAAGAPVDAEDGDGSTPLLSAVRGARLDLARALLAAKADPRKVNRRGDTVLGALMALDDRDETPLAIARAAGREDLAQALIAAGAR